MKMEGEVGMEALQVPDSMKEMMSYIEGGTIQEKLGWLIISHLENRFRSCTERLYEFEKKYRLSFEQFKGQWNSDTTERKYSYAIEKDYMEWESLDDEHDLLLSQMRQVKEGLGL